MLKSKVGYSLNPDNVIMGYEAVKKAQENQPKTDVTFKI